MQLSIQKRTVLGKKVKELRSSDIIPAVLYGLKKEPISLQFKKNDFLKIYETNGTATPIQIKGEGVDQLVLIKDIKLHAVSDMLQHVDFFALDAKIEVEVEVPLLLKGEPPLRKNKDYSIQLVQDSVMISALPHLIPHDLYLDISDMDKTSDVLFAKDIVLPNGVTLLTEEDVALVTVTNLAAIEEAEAKAEAEAEINTIESSEPTTPEKENK